MSPINGFVELLWVLLYDVLGLFLPGAALLTVIQYTALTSNLHSLVSSMFRIQDTRQLALFVGVSYLLGYAIQGVVSSISRLFQWWRARRGKEVRKDTGVSVAGSQVRGKVIQTEVYKALQEQLAEYYKMEKENVDFREVRNLAYSVAGDQAANAYRFVFRAELCFGLAVVAIVGLLLALFQLFSRGYGWSLLAFYLLLALLFFWRGRYYNDIGGRIIFPIGLVALTNLREKKAQKAQGEGVQQ